MTTDKSRKQNVTISLDRQTIQKAKVIAARRLTSISGLLAQQIESLVGDEDAYERARRQAVTDAFIKGMRGSLARRGMASELERDLDRELE